MRSRKAQNFAAARWHGFRSQDHAALHQIDHHMRQGPPHTQRRPQQSQPHPRWRIAETGLLSQLGPKDTKQITTIGIQFAIQTERQSQTRQRRQYPIYSNHQRFSAQNWSLFCLPTGKISG